MSNEKPHENPFEAARPEETLPLLQSAVARNSPLQCWSSGQKHSYLSRIVKVSEVSGIVTIGVAKDAPGAKEFETALVNEALEELLFSLKLPTDVIFFKGELRVGDGSYFNLRVKDPIFKVQRRESFRLPISESTASPVFLKLVTGERFEGKIINLSDGGIAVSIPDAAAFQKLNEEKPLIEVSFKVFGADVTATANVRHGYEVGSALMKKERRLGIEFVTIDPKLKTRLSQIVFEESAKLIGRK